MDLTFNITADDLGPAFARWAENQAVARGKTTQEIIDKAMRYWVSFAMAKIPEGDRAKVDRQLTALTNASSRLGLRRGLRSRGGKRADKYRGTVAAAMVAILNYDGARDKARAGDRAGFYGSAGKFLSRRKRSVNHHRFSGFIPALNVLARGRGTRRLIADDLRRGPKYKHPPGLIAHQLTDLLASVLVEAWPSGSPRPGRPAPVGLRGLAPDAFSRVIPEIGALLIRFADEDGVLTDSARTAGFNVITGTPGNFNPS